MNAMTPSNARTARRKRASSLVVAAFTFLFAAPLHAKDDHNISDDLKAAAKAPKTSKNSWINTSGAITYAKVVIIANSGDPDLVALRKTIVASGGTVYYKYLSVNGLLAMVPLSQVPVIAARADVASISADRVTTKTFSAVELMSGVSTSLRSTYVANAKAAAADGRGVGIAFLDSGLMRTHEALLDASGNPRIAKSVDVTALVTSSSQSTSDGQQTGNNGNWAPGLDYTINFVPGSANQRAWSRPWIRRPTRSSTATAESPATTIIAVLMESVEQLRKVEIFDPIHLVNLKQHYMGMMEANGTCERIKSTPIPYSYSFFIKCYITIFILIMPLVLVESSGYWMVPVTMIGAYAMLGLEMIGNEIENPFGYDSNDLPITLISNKIRVSVHDLLGVELPDEKKAWASRPYSIVH